MTASIFHAIIEKKDSSAQVLLEVCESLAPGLFTQLIDDVENPLPGDSLKYIILFIALAYSRESPRVVMGMHPKVGKELIARYLEIPDIYLQYTVNLLHKTVRKVVMEYLDFQADRDFRHLMRKRDMYELMVDQSMTNMVKEDQSLDYKSLLEANKHINELMKDIESYEIKMSDRYAFIFDNISDIKNVDTGQIFSLRIEDSKFIK